MPDQQSEILRSIQRTLQKLQQHIETIAQYSKAEQNQNRRDAVRFWLEIGGLSVAIILLCLTLATLRVFEGQLQEMQKQTKATDLNFRRDERAWVGLDVPVTLDAIAIQTPRVLIKGHYGVKNFGHGPAAKVVSQFGNFVDPTNRDIANKEAENACDGPIKFSTGTVPVGGDLKQPPPFGYTLFPNQGHSESIDYQGPTETLTFLRFVGCIAYIDQFKAVHWTRFCMERRPGDPAQVPMLNFCALYNDTDPDEAK